MALACPALLFLCLHSTLVRFMVSASISERYNIWFTFHSGKIHGKTVFLTHEAAESLHSTLVRFMGPATNTTENSKPCLHSTLVRFMEGA